MKSQKAKSSLFWVKILAIMILLTFTYCDDNYLNEPTEPNLTTLTDENEIQLNDFINQINLDSEIFIVSNENSIQQAIDLSSSGDAIFIEPGIYTESLKLTKENISLIALGSTDEKVILENSELTIHTLQSNQLKQASPYITMNRENLGNNIAHYTFDVRVGNGEFDLIRIHRLVSEKHPFRPVKTTGDIFMIHGAIQDFDDIFLTAGADVINSETSAPYYLATNKIDVWGIDLAWTKVPIETTDFAFMEGWGVEKDINHTKLAMKIARLIRGFSGQGFSKMNLLGFSYGVHVAYGSAALETQMHPIAKDIKGLIPVDSQLKSNDPSIIESKCEAANYQMNLINEGEFHNPWGVGLIGLAELALNAPNDASPVPDFAGLTNLQVMNAIGSDRSAGWHFLGGTPFELYYSDPYRFVSLCVGLSAHMPRQMFYEMAATSCPSLDVSYDDHLGDIEIPIFYISAEGGVGGGDDYTASLTQSNDLSHLNVIDETRETEVNIGHADLWMGYDSKDLMWEKLHAWLITHKN
ncbi:hypothetical protein [Labilibaculum sp.]|uniref:hypothetical protein n=1 Tax=Labilibaculum sp. TaxID=2060723 RepID=UPI00356B2CEA